MKTLDEIVKRSDYARLSKQLAKRVEELAKIVQEKMEYLDLCNDPDYEDGICVNNVTLAIHCRCASGFTYSYLAIESDASDIVWGSLKDVGRDYYYCGNYHARVVGATHKDALRFLNAARDILQALNDIETKQADAISQALTSTSDL